MKKKLSLFCVIIATFLLFPFMSFAGEATLSWQPNAEPDLEGYRVYYGTEPGSYGPFVPAGNNTTKTITGLTEGETYYFVVTAVDQAGNESGYSSPPASKTIEPSNPTAVSVTPSVLSPQSVGTSVKLDSEAIGGSGNYEYKYWIRNQAGYWKCVQDYSTSNSYTWDTTNYSGTNLIQVWARNAGSSASYEAYSSAFKYEVTGGIDLPTSVSVLGSMASPQLVGTPVKLDAQAIGGSGNYEYKYWVRNQAGYWKCVQEYSTSNSYTWDTTNYFGTNLIQVWARNAGSSAPYEAYSSVFTYQVTGGISLPTSVSVAANISSPQSAGTSVTLGAEATGGSGDYEYKYWIRNQAAGNWKCVQDYSTTNSYTWDTTNYSGTNLIQVWARNAGSSASYEAYSTVFTYEVTGGTSLPTSVSVGANISSPQLAGTTITLTAQADGGSGSYEYRYWVKKSDGAWKCIQEYSQSSTCAWDTTDFSGANLIHVWARNVGSSALYEVASQVNLAYMIN